MKTQVRPYISIIQFFEKTCLPYLITFWLVWNKGRVNDGACRVFCINLLYHSKTKVL